MNQQPRHPLLLFYSYAHEDEALRNALDKHLIPLQYKGLIVAQDDHHIPPGADRSYTIRQYLKKSEVILLLVSPDYLASASCYQTEMPQALERHQMGDALVIPVLLRPVDIDATPFAHLQSLPRNGKPVTLWEHQDAAFHEIAKELRHLLENLRATTFAGSEVPPFVEHDQSIQTSDGGQTRSQKEVVYRVKYLKYLKERYGTVMLPIEPVEGLTLQAIFQPLMLRSDPLAAEDLRHQKRHTLLHEAYLQPEEQLDLVSNQRELFREEKTVIVAQTSEEALEKSPQKRMVVLGGPGTGKTTVLQFLIYKHACKALIDLSAPLPILISLPDLARSEKTFSEYLFRLAKEARIPDHGAILLEQAFDEGRAFLCLDSLDEVKPELRSDLIHLINTYAASTGNLWVIGSRFTEYKGGQFQRGCFAEWELQPLTHHLRLELARRLLPELDRHFQRHQNQVCAEPLAFVQHLEAHSQAATWGENPLLFSLAAVVFVRLGTLPVSRATLYKEVTSAVIETREKNPARRQVLQCVLTYLALELYLTKGRTFSLADLLAQLPTIRQRQQEIWKTEEMASRLIASGLFDVLPQETYSFRHQTFQEYLAAVELAHRLTDRNDQVQKEAWQLAWSKRTYSRWTEILRLMVGALIQDADTLGQVEACRWIRSLLDLRWTEEGDPGSLGLQLALASVGELSELVEKKHLPTMIIMEQAFSTWIRELFAVPRTRRKEKWQRLLGFARDIGQWSDDLQQDLINRMMRGLMDRDANVREVAVQVLGQQGERVPLRVFLECLGDKDRDVQESLVEVLGNQKDRVPLEDLLNLFEDEDEIVQKVAMLALGHQGERVPLEILLTRLKSEDPSMRAIAIEALGHQGERVPLEVLFARLENEHWFVRSAVKRVLIQQGKRIPLEALLAYLEHKNEDMRKVATQALYQQGAQIPLEALLDCLANENRDVQVATVKALGRRQEQVSLEVLLTHLGDKNLTIRMEAIRALGQRQNQVPLEVLLSHLERLDGTVRVAAMQVLVSHGEQVPLEEWLVCLEHNDQDVRAAAVLALGEQGERVPLKVLQDCLDHKNPHVRAAAVLALGKQGERVPLEMLLACLKDKNESVRVQAAIALGMQGERVPLEVLLACLKDKNESVREVTASALGKQGERIPLEVIWACLEDRDPNVRLRAAEALGKHGKRMALEVLLSHLKDKNPDVRRGALLALGEHGEQAPLEMLLACLDDNDRGVRAAALEVLSQYGDRIPLETLIVCLEDKDVSVRWTAIETLGKQGKRVPLEIFLPYLEDKDVSVRLVTVRVLGQQKNRVPLEALLIRLEDQHQRVRAAAIQALGQQESLIPLKYIKAAIGDEDADVRQAAIDVIATRDRESITQVIEEAKIVLQRQPADHILGSLTHGFMAEVIGEMKCSSPVLFARLMFLLDWHYWQVRVKAIQAIGSIRRSIPDSVIKRLLELRHASSSRVREAADDALAEILALETGIEDD